MRPITGSIVALVTPMHPDGSVDYDTFKALIDWHVAEGTNCVGVVGTTGESPTVSMAENCELIRVAVEHAAGRVPILAGTGANNTLEAIELARYAKQVGADAHLSVVPYYNKPSQDGIVAHYRAITEAVDLPLMLYNVPGRTVADLQPDTALRCAELPGVFGIKEATGNIERAAYLIKHAPAGYAIYSGDDGTAPSLMLMGGAGVVSVTANVAPRLMARMCAAALQGDVATATALHFTLLELHQALFCEPSPAPTKWALSRLGRCNNALRLPLLPLTDAGQARVEGALREAQQL
jgi:4-hydroxy-tetrahydrodipicolinate synthase